MRYESKTEVIIPAHKVKQFKTSMVRHAPSEHGFRSVEFSHVTVRTIQPSPGGNVVAQVLLDNSGSELAIEDAGEAAEETIVWALLKLGAEAHLDVTTRAVG